MVHKIIFSQLLDEKGNLKEMEVESIRFSIAEGNTVLFCSSSFQDFTITCNTIEEFNRTLDAYIWGRKESLSSI